MEKIIQIAVTEEDLHCLTEDGKVYRRNVKVTGQEAREDGSKYSKGYRFWEEVPEIKNF